MLNKFVEEVNCLYCGKKFKRLTKPNSKVRLTNTRQYNSKTCCHKCSDLYATKKRKEYNFTTK